MKTLISPSILSADFLCLGSEIDSLGEEADYLHFDVMDGHFVPPLTFGTPILKALSARKTPPIEAHLMTLNPRQYFEEYVSLGVSTIIIHQECSPHLHYDLCLLRSLGVRSGVALNPSTPVSSVREVVDLIDVLLIMTVNPGWGGQGFIESSVSKISEAAALIEKTKRHIDIEVDGGINEHTGPRCVRAGATILVSGSHIFSTDDRQRTIKNLRTSEK